MQPNASVIIITYNEETRVPRVLNALKKQRYQDFETIVVDSKSTDGTVAAARAAGKGLRQFRVIRMRSRGVALGRNTGARAARGRYLVFLDADVDFDEHFLTDALRAMSRSGYGVGGVYVQADSTHPVDRLYYAILSAWFWLTQKIYPHVIGACMLATREAHNAIHGFDEHITLAEDNDYVLRASKRFRVGMLPVRVRISARRFAEEGRLRLGLLYLRVLLHRLWKGEIKDDSFQYRFGHYRK